jgi:hypothetical protein
MSHRGVPSLSLTICLLGLSVCFEMLSLAHAADPPADPPMTSEREVVALQFARQHHPELAQLLDQLKARNSRQYTAAIRDLFKSADRLERLRSRNPERYETELRIWQLDSQIRLLAARLASMTDSALDEELRGLLRQRQSIVLKQLEDDRARIQARLERLDKSIDELQSQGDALVEREFHRLQQNAHSRVPQTRSTAPKSTASPREKTSDPDGNR